MMEEQEQRSVNVEEEGYQKIPGAGVAQTEMSAATAEVMRWILDSLERIEIISHELKGEVMKVNAQGEYYWEEEPGRRMLNDVGVNKIIFFIKPSIDKGHALGNITEEYAHKMTEALVHPLIDELAYNAAYWGMDVNMYESIVMYLDEEIYLSLTKIVNGGIRNLMKHTIKRVETYGNQDKKKGGFLGLGNIFGKK